MPSKSRAKANTGTVGDYFSAIIGDWRNQRVISWPPDVFCLLAALLQKTGAYIRLVDRWPPLEGRGTPTQKLARWKKATLKLAEN